MLLIDLITEQTITQPPEKLPAAGGVSLPPQPGTAGDAGKALVAGPKPNPTTSKPQASVPGQEQQDAQDQQVQGGTQQAQPTNNQQVEADLEERVMKRIQQLAGMLGR